ncbi:MAG TPA: hypothetical protein VN158_00160, partial [Caulobacter sp.]|nr:hypothetical protein [Caulobacter sp.]
MPSGRVWAEPIHAGRVQVVMTGPTFPEHDLRKIRLKGGTDLAFRVAGDPGRTALLLMHGDVGSSWLFRKV